MKIHCMSQPVPDKLDINLKTLSPNLTVKKMKL